MPSKVVLRVFFPDGLFKTALIDSDTTALGLISIIGRKLSLEYSAKIDIDSCELYECEIENPEDVEDLKPLWVKRPFGDAKNKLNPQDIPFECVQKWISTEIAVRCRFVMVYKLPKEFTARKRSDSSRPSSVSRPASTSLASHRSLSISRASSSNCESSAASSSYDSSTPSTPHKECEASDSPKIEEKYFDFINTHRAPGKAPVKSYDDVRNGVPILDVLEFVSKIKVSVKRYKSSCMYI